MSLSHAPQEAPLTPSLSHALQDAPFTPVQRAWLNDFLAGVLGLGMGSPPARSASATTRPGAAVDRQHPISAAVLDVRRLTADASAKDVRFVSFDLRGSGLTYSAGDALGVYPENCPELVEALLEALRATGDEPVKTPSGRVTSARDALTRWYTITRISHPLLRLLAEAATEPAEKQWLRALIEGDEAGFLEGGDLLDLVAGCTVARHVPVARFVEALSPIQPRLYSISSSPYAHPQEIHLTVGVVRYSHHGCNRLRKGVASSFLSERVQAGHKVRIFVQPSHGFRLPADNGTPVIMVGPGTGIAPFRAFLQERKARRATGKSWLIFGDQRRACDFLYREELEEYLGSGTLTHLDTAFSRDQQQKVYVQHRMLENGPRIWSWLRSGAHFYVCGDASRMARDVDRTLHQIVATEGWLSETGAKSYVKELARAKRYQRDVY